MNEQEQFWTKEYTNEYVTRNSNFDFNLGVEGWNKILNGVDKSQIKTILECGSNIGRNIGLLNNVLPSSKKSIIEIAKEPFDFVTRTYQLEYTYNGSIIESNLQKNYFDLVFTNGVLIHIHPDEVLENMKKIYQYSNKYIIISEYFNTTPTMIEYRGKSNKLFKSDFGKTFVQNFDVEIIDYGFLWGFIYDNAGFNDVTYWVFKKKQK